MNILHVIATLDRLSGGPANAIRHIVRHQTGLGHQVGIASTSFQMGTSSPASADELDGFRREPAFQDAEVFFCRWQSPIRMGYHFGRSSQLGQMFSECRSKICPDIVHIHSAFSHVTAGAAWWARRHRIPYVCRPAGILNPRYLASGRASVKRMYLRLSYLRDLHHAAMVHTTSALEQQDVISLAPCLRDRCRVIPFGTEVNCCDLQSVRDRFLKQHPGLRERPVILFLSRISAVKRPDMLIAACARLRNRYPNLAVLMAGNSDSYETVVRQAVADSGMAEHVHFVGFVDGKDKCGAFAAADLFVLPSIAENFGIVTVEAMAHGVPVVVTDGVASHQYVDRCRGGLTVAGNVDSLADGMDKLLANDASGWGARGRQFVRAHLSWRAMVKKLDAEYGAIVIREAPSPCCEVAA